MKATMKKVLSLVIVLTMVAATMMIVPLTANAKLPATDLSCLLFDFLTCICMLVREMSS